MKDVTATELANNTGDVLNDAKAESVGITRHGQRRFVLMSVKKFNDLTNAQTHEPKSE